MYTALAILLATAIILIAIALRCYMIVPPGHVSAASLYGNVRPRPYRPGMHYPVNPFLQWHLYDIRQKSHKEAVNVPTQDQLQTRIEVAVQFRIDGDAVPRMVDETGTVIEALNVHVIPKLRSLLREQGKTVQRAEDFFLESTHDMLQANLLAGLQEFLEPKGILVDAVLALDITLPPFITEAIESKKQREQEAEKQKAELDRFSTEQQQKVVEAEAERNAAQEEAKRRRILADAQAYEIEQLNRAIGEDPSYIRLQALDSLRAIAKDPAAKLYFLDGNSPMPLPLMHLGDAQPDRKSAQIDVERLPSRTPKESET